MDRRMHPYFLSLCFSNFRLGLGPLEKSLRGIRNWREVNDVFERTKRQLRKSIQEIDHLQKPSQKQERKPAK